MPVMKCQKNGKPGYKWGQSGVCFLGPNARARALAVGRAIAANKDRSDTMERQSFQLDVKDLDDESGTFTGHAAIFGNVDRGGDIIKRGAFKRTLRERKTTGRPLKMMYRHREPIGVFTSIKEDTKGLLVEGRPLIEEVQLAAEAAALMKIGALDELSIGFETVESEIDKKGNRILLDIELHEVSLVPFAMNPKAQVTSVKTLDEFETIDELIDALQEGQGFEEAAARRVAEAAWAVLHEPDDSADTSQTVQAVANLTARLRGSTEEMKGHE